MDVAMMQMMSKPISTKTAATKPTTSVDSNMTNGPSNKFGSVFGQIISSSNQIQQPTQSGDTKDTSDLTAVLNAGSIEDVLDLLEIPHDDGLLMLQIGDEGKAVAIDEMLNLDNLMDALGIDAEQLQKLVQQLLGEDKEAQDVWELLALVDAQAPMLQTQIVAALQGEGQVTLKEAAPLLQVLKLTQLMGQKRT